MHKVRGLVPIVVLVCALLILAGGVWAQETTGGLQGTIKDPSGAVVPGAKVAVTGATLVGSKELETDSSGYYRFANLPPGTYTLTVTAKGFKTVKREGLVLEVGHLPTIDIGLEVGTTATTVEVTGAAPVIDTTTTQNLTNLTEDVLSNAPHGYSFQSVIQYAPMARGEPLAGGTAGITTGGVGGSLPGSSANGMSAGFSIGGAADSESTYLVEGQDTENISGGASSANVPFDFIQEVEMKTSGIQAEYGGALGGVVNVIMKKGGNEFHGSLGTTYESDGMDASPNATLRYDPLALNTPPEGFENDAQTYQPKKDHFRTVQPDFTLGGPIKKDRMWFFLGFAPQYRSLGRTVNFNPTLCSTVTGLVCPDATFGSQLFTQDSQQYYGTARIDASLTSKIRVYASWLYQLQRLQGSILPTADPVDRQSAAYLNTAILAPVANYSHGLGFTAPNSTYNVGADISLTPKIVSTTRYGYFFQNYHDFGWPISSPSINWANSGLGATENCLPVAPATTCTGPQLPLNLQQPQFANTAPFDTGWTKYNASKHYQFNEDVAFFKGGWWGTHNIKVGYQLNHLSNVIFQDGNVPYVALNVGQGQSYSASTTTGGGNCGTLEGAYGACAGLYGYATVNDFATILPQPATDWNHALFAQDAWTVGHGLTLSLGIRIEKESLPVPNGVIPSGFAKPTAINFSWGDKVAPRLGAAWGTANGKMKIFGSYGVVNDVMKLLLAQTSWGAQSYETCVYALGPDSTGGFSVSDLDLTFVNNRACPNGPPTQGANFASGKTPTSLTDASTGVSLIENTNFRPWEPIAPNVKPYRQHEYVAGWDYQIKPSIAFEVRYDRRRLDHVIEDASLADPTNFELYTVVNPGEGVDKTIDGYASYLKSLGDVYGVQTAPGSPPYAFDANPAAPFGTCPSCPPNPKAIRNYDGVEFRLTKSVTRGWAGMFSYTYSSLWGNYTGLTTTDQIDGGVTGRNSPDTTRSFDEPFYYFTYQGKSNAGPLPTDRPSVFKGNVYYNLPWKGMTTTFGIFQVAYEGSPMSSFVDLGYQNGGPVEATYIFGRGKWVNLSVDPTTGAITLGNPYDKRTPWYTQTDFNAAHEFKVKERQTLRFEGTFTNLLNQHAPVSYWEGFASNYVTSFFFPYQVFGGAPFYQTTETGYSPQAALNSANTFFNTYLGHPFLANSRYGQPNIWQLSRSIRLGVRFTF
jgi:hypothetical protein